MIDAYKPTRPCSTCGSTKFGIVSDVAIEVTSRDMKRGNIAYSRFTVIVCVDCNETRFFNNLDAQHLLTSCHHTIVDVAPKYPYR